VGTTELSHCHSDLLHTLRPASFVVSRCLSRCHRDEGVGLVGVLGAMVTHLPGGVLEGEGPNPHL
jgi:hypothetical protein